MKPCMRCLRGLNSAAIKRRYNESGDHDSELRLLLLACEGAEDRLSGGYTSEVNQAQHHGQRTVDEGTVYEGVYLVKPIAHYGYPHGDREAYERRYEYHVSYPLEPM